MHVECATVHGDSHHVELAGSSYACAIGESKVVAVACYNGVGVTRPRARS